MVGNSKMLKEYNQALILDIIRQKETVSKAELAKTTGLSANAVGNIAELLMVKGYICPAGNGVSRGGRRPELLALRPGALHSLGVDIDTDRVRFVLLDFAGSVIHTKRIKMNCIGNCDEVFEVINSEIKNYSQYNLHGAGLAVAGQVDFEKGFVVSSPNLKWENIDAAGKIEGVKVYVENEAMTSAIFEKWSGECKDTENFLCVNSKSGIGAGIFIKGELYRGANGSAGEIGHVIVDVNGELCECGNRGCLETFSSSERIARVLGVSTIDEAIELADACDARALEEFKRSAFYLGVALAGVVNTLNPQKIVLGKEFVKYGRFIIDEVTRIVHKKALRLPSQGLEIVVSKEGVLSSAMGAAVLPLWNIFKGV